MNKIDECLKKIDETIDKGVYKDNWQSLSVFKMPEWYKRGRFGLFVHWGVYSVPATQTEWYPRLMYIKGMPSYRHRINTYGKDCDYRQIVEKFKPDKFDADEWVNVFKASGAKYIMPVGEHHDGIKMYGSELNKWNTVELNGRNYMRELHDACDKNGMGFCISNHRAEHFWYFNGARKYCPDSEVARGEHADLYGPAYVPPSGNIYRTDKEIDATEEWLKDWLASACEMVDLNKPLAVYFDWWVHKKEFKPYLKKFLAYYYNRGAEWGKEVGVFYKWGAVMDGCAIFDVERGQIDGAARRLWQNDTAIAKNSWGYTNGNKFKSSSDIVRNMIEVIAKNGCYMLNVGPKCDGVICDEEKAVLLSIGEWLKVNGEAIYDSEPFEVTFKEGRKTRNGAFKENRKFKNNEYCFTYKTGAIYVFPMGQRLNSKISVKSLRHANEGGIRYQIQNIEILGSDLKVNYTQTENELLIDFGRAIDNTMPICLKVSVD